MKSYHQACEFLDQFINYEKKREGLIYDPSTFNLEGFRRFMGELDNPQNAFRSIHIAGTKGKGSVAAILEAALASAGLQTGVYTSPHIATYLERFHINGRNITEEKFVGWINFLRGKIKESQRKPPRRYRTVFELLTALAFLYFQEQKVDIAILETGLGGRLDATNVVLPLVSVITPIGLDHTNLLGTHLRDIAREKGGIIKKNTPLVLANQKKNGKSDIEAELDLLCKRNLTPLIRAENLVKILKRKPFLKKDQKKWTAGQRLLFQTEKGDRWEVELPLAGRHQAENCRTALATLLVAREKGIHIELSRAASGIARTKWPGRFEVLPGAPPLVLDGAHCPLSAKALREALEEYFPSRPRLLLLGILSGKNPEGIFRELSADPLLKRVIAFKPMTPRGLSAGELAGILKGLFSPVDVAPTPEEAITKALGLATHNMLLVMTGSLYNIYPAKRFFLQKN